MNLQLLRWVRTIKRREKRFEQNGSKYERKNRCSSNKGGSRNECTTEQEATRIKQEAEKARRDYENLHGIVHHDTNHQSTDETGIKRMIKSQLFIDQTDGGETQNVQNRDQLDYQ